MLRISTLYKSLVGPVIEYTILVWNLHLSKDVVLLEKSQGITFRLALDERRGAMTYEENLERLNWS